SPSRSSVSTKAGHWQYSLGSLAARCRVCIIREPRPVGEKKTKKAGLRLNSESFAFLRLGIGIAQQFWTVGGLCIYLHGPGTGMTNLPSFSAMKFPLVIDDGTLASFLSMVIMSLLVGLSGKHTLPPPMGESFGIATFFISSAVKSTSSILEIFSPASDDCILL